MIQAAGSTDTSLQPRYGSAEIGYLEIWAEGLGLGAIQNNGLTAVSAVQVCPDVAERIVFQCGPAAMMNRVADELANLHFPLKNLHQESFDF